MLTEKNFEKRELGAKYLIEIISGEKYSYCGRNPEGFIHWNPADRWNTWDIKEYGFNEYKTAYNDMLKLKRMYKRLGNIDYFTFKIRKFVLFLK